MVHRELAPIIIGITGKRELEGREASVRASLKAIFDYLDEKYPSSPKILLTALAKGADTVAAEEVLERKGWEVVAPLPLSLDLYLQDFDDHAAAQLRGLVDESNGRKKLRIFTLDPLRHRVEGRPLASSELALIPGTENPDRVDQYEQVGLFIAERCAILIAVMREDEKPDRVGGTARVVRYRLDGTLDDHARSVVQRSRVLVEPAPLDVPPAGPTWLVDLATVGLQRPESGPAGFKILLPSEEDSTESHQLRESFRLADRLNEFNIRTQRLDEAKVTEVATARLNMGPPSAMLYRLMDALSTIQVGMNKKLKSSFWALASLFCIALFMFEAQIDLNKPWGVFGYIGALVLGIAIYKFAWARRWQPFAQDYRAVAEALRVQTAWWNSGLVGARYRVDRFYLRGTTGSLGLVRAAIRHMIDAATLVSSHQKGREDGDSRGPESEAQARAAGARWIAEQIAYFDNRFGKRRTWVSFIDALSWFLLVSSLGPELIVAVNSIRGDIVRPVLEQSLGKLPPGVPFIAVVVVMLLMFVINSAPWVFSRSGWTDRSRQVFESPNIIVAGAAGVLLAIGLYDCAALIRPERVSGALLILGGVLVASVAYAMQFVSYELSWDGELRGYEDALEVFRRANRALKAVENSKTDAAEKSVLQTTIIEALGREALKENESWLRAHRERPLQPLPPA